MELLLLWNHPPTRLLSLLLVPAWTQVRTESEASTSSPAELWSQPSLDLWNPTFFPYKPPSPCPWDPSAPPTPPRVWGMWVFFTPVLRRWGLNLREWISFKDRVKLDWLREWGEQNGEVKCGLPSNPNSELDCFCLYDYVIEDDMDICWTLNVCVCVHVYIHTHT